jgi:hypothetical protein
MVGQERSITMPNCFSYTNMDSDDSPADFSSIDGATCLTCSETLVMAALGSALIFGQLNRLGQLVLHRCAAVQ